MFHTIKDIRDTLDDYNFDYINCFQRPAAILYKHLLPGSEFLYLMNCKLIDAFHSDIIRSELSNYEDKIGMRCTRVSIKSREDFEEALIELVKQGHAVLVPGNLIEVFYSKYYKTKDWGHLLIIKGYDEERKLFMSMDCLQMPEENAYPRYYDFPFRFDDVYHFYEQYMEGYRDSVYYIEIAEEEIDLKEKLVQFLEQFQKIISNQCYKEYDIVNWLKTNGSFLKMDKSIEINAYKTHVLNIPKYKKVILDQIQICMQKYSYTKEKFSFIYENLNKAWKKDTLIFLKQIEADDYANLTFEVSKKTKIYEDELVEELKIFIAYLKNWQDESRTELAKFQCENNYDNIIYFKDNKYTFDFNTGKIYNMWLGDSCPKVILYDCKENKENFLLRAKCSILIDCEKTGYQAGLFIRTNKDEVFTFACNEEKRFLLDFVGKYTIGDFEVNYDVSEFELYVKKEGERLSIGRIEHSIEWIELGQYDLNFQIEQAGLFCKTWDDCKRLYIIFKDCSIQ